MNVIYRIGLNRAATRAWFIVRTLLTTIGAVTVMVLVLGFLKSHSSTSVETKPGDALRLAQARCLASALRLYSLCNSGTWHATLEQLYQDYLGSRVPVEAFSYRVSDPLAEPSTIIASERNPDASGRLILIFGSGNVSFRRAD